MPVARRLATVTASLLVAVGLTAAPADAGLAVPVDCSHGTVALRWDDVTYDLDGTCGTVKVLADDAVVRVPTATKVLVRGHRNLVTSSAVDTLVVRGRHQEVRPASARVLSVRSPGSEVAVEGLVETARLAGRRATVTADRVYTTKAPGTHNTLRAGRGFDAAIGGDDNRLRYRRLDSLVVTGDDNAVRVRRGATDVRDAGHRNRIATPRR